MAEQTAATGAEKSTDKDGKPKKYPGMPIGKMALAEVDAALTDCDRTIKTQSETVKVKLASGGAIPPAALRELSKANSMKGKLAMRRIALLMELGDASVVELMDKLLKVKPARH